MGDSRLRWRVTALVLGCLLALAGPYLLLTRVAGSTDDPQASARAITTTPPGLALSRAPTAAVRATTARTSTAATPRTTPSSTSGGGDVSGSDTAAGTPLGEAMASCRLDSLRVQASLGAADVSLSQFDKHIDAMNLLVAGKISYAVATQFWDETRIGAAQNAAEYRRSHQSLDGTRCQGLDPALADTLPYGPVNQLNQCVAFVSRGSSALTKADAAVTTWQHHIHDMEMLRMGDITPAQATSMWRRNWQTGQRQLSAFEAALTQARAVRCSLD
ncbi:hypothetical protein GCM10027517_36870 [Phycicoccus ginsengisoli]